MVVRGKMSDAAQWLISYGAFGALRVSRIRCANAGKRHCIYCALATLIWPAHRCCWILRAAYGYPIDALTQFALPGRQRPARGLDLAWMLLEYESSARAMRSGGAFWGVQLRIAQWA